MVKKVEKHLIREVLKHSNWIERVYEDNALEDAMRAWRYAYKNIDKIDIKYVLKVHEIMMRRTNLRIAGKVRKCDVWIGGKRKRFISTSLLEEEIKGWCKICDINKIKNFSKERKEKTIRDWHIMFEALHPFEDCNGRTGRLLMNIHRVKAGLDPLFIRGWNLGDKNFHKDQEEYYKWFK